jgi:hypothetical protein
MISAVACETTETGFVLLQEPVPPLLASALEVYKGLRVYQLFPLGFLTSTSKAALEGSPIG